MFRILCKRFLIAMSISLAMLCGVLVPAFASDSVLTYFVNSDGNAVVTGCDGSCGTSDLVIPSELSGHPVVAIAGGLGSQGLTSVSIPSSVTTIGELAFYGNRIESLVIPSSVTTIGFGAFYGNRIESLELPSTVTTIGGLAFANNWLTSLEIPSSVTWIGFGAFRDNDLTSVTFLGDAPSAGSGVFEGNSNLNHLDVSSSTKGWLRKWSGIAVPAFDSVPVLTYFVDINGKAVVTGCDGSCGTSDLVIPSVLDGYPVVHIAGGFGGQGLTSVSIPSSVITIGDLAFYGNRIESLVIPSSVSTIGYIAFGYNRLTSVAFLGDAPSAGYGVFYGNSNLNHLDVSSTAQGWGATLSGIPVTMQVWTPSAPAITSLGAIAGRATVTFGAPSFAGRSAITDYLIQYRAANATNWSTFAHAPSATTLSYTITGLTNGVTYEFRVSAINGAGVGQASETSSAEPNKAIPSVSVNPTASEIEVGQTLSASSLTAGSVSKAGTWSWLNLSLTPGRGTSSQVAVFTPTDSANYESVQVSIPVKVNLLPLRPAISSVTSDNGSITATIAPARGITARTITGYQYSLDGGQSTFDAELSGRSFTVSGLVNGQQVSVQVRAVNADGVSPWSSVKTAIPANTPDAPQITFVRAGMNSLLVHFVAPNTSGARIRSFQYSLDGGQSWQTPSTPTPLSPIKITGLTRKTDYQIQVRGINIKGAGEGSNVVNVRTANCSMSQCTKFYLPQ